MVDTENKLNLKHFSHYQYAINEVKKHIQGGPEGNTSLLLNGHSGSGKSTIVDLLIHQLDLDILYINSDTYENASKLNVKIKTFCTFDSVLAYFSRKSKVIFIDDLDVLINIDRNFCSTLLEILKNKEGTLKYVVNCPIICVGNMLKEKKLSDIAEVVSKNITLTKLTFKQCFRIVDSYATKHDLELDYENLTHLIKSSAHDLRFIFNNLTIGRKNNDVEEEEGDLKNKYSQLNTSDLSRVVTSVKLSGEAIQTVIWNDMNGVVSLIHENVYKKFNGKKYCEDSLQLLVSLNEALLETEQVSEYSFENIDFNLWELSQYHKLKKINNLTTEYATTYGDVLPSIMGFSQVVNKQSLALNFNKKLLKLEQNMCMFRSNPSHILMYIDYLLKDPLRYPDYKTILTKNELEILSSFVNEYNPTRKGIITKMKTMLVS
jgi:energy-coupling factor transporter ATP-binding protein EcfA2